MAITKPAVLPVWADSGDKTQPSDVEIQNGWPLTNVPPSRQRFNWFFNYASNAIRYFSRRGLPDWDSAETYMIGDIVIGNDGAIYRSKIDSNLNKTPSSSPTEWEPSLSSLADIAAGIQKQTYTAFTTGGTAPNYTLTPSPAITSYQAGQRFRVKVHAGSAIGVAKTLNVSGLGAKSFVMRNDAGSLSNVGVVTDQLVDAEYDGVQFVMLSNLAITSATTAKTGVVQLASAAQILSAVANVAMTPDQFAANSLLTGGGPWYYQLPGGFTINFGKITAGHTTFTAVSFPAPFTTVLAAWATAIFDGASANSTSAHVGNVSTSGMSVGLTSSVSPATGAYWFAIGVV